MSILAEGHLQTLVAAAVSGTAHKCVNIRRSSRGGRPHCRGSSKEAARAGALMSESDNVAVSSLVLSNTPSSVPQLEREAAALVEAAGSVDAFMDRATDSSTGRHSMI